MQEPLLYIMDEAAEMLRIKRRRLQMLLHEYPFYRMIGRRKVFTSGDLKKIIEALPRPSRLSSAKGRPTGTSAASGSKGSRRNTLVQAVRTTVSPSPDLGVTTIPAYWPS